MLNYQESQMKKNIEILERDDILNDKEFCNKYKSHFALALLLRGSEFFVKNIKTKIFLIKCDDHIIPCTLNNTEYNNAVNCSPHTSFVSYPKLELKKTKRLPIVFLRIILSLFDMITKLFKFNRVIQVNNFLSINDRQPAWLSEYLPEITKILTSKYPTHAIYIPRVFNFTSNFLYKNLLFNNYKCLPIAVAYFFDFRKSTKTKFRLKRDHRRDLKTLNTSTYKAISLENPTQAQIRRAHELYQLIYLDKHARFNPDYTVNYFEWHMKSKNHIFLGLLNQKIDAFICLRIMNNLATAAPGGYDSNLSQNLNLYRQQNALTIEYTKAKNYLLNLGPGVDRFKLNRGGIPVFQYSAVYFHHLSFARKIPWFLLQRALKFMTIERYLKVVSK